MSERDHTVRSRRAGGRAWVGLVVVLAAFGSAPAFAQEPPELASAPTSPRARFGVAVSSQWVSVPRWLLNTFTDANKPLSTYGLGAQVFWRDALSSREISIGFTYQRMSPPDGNWLGAGDKPSDETDFIQFRNVALLGLDATVTWRTELAPNFGLHYGAGLGLAVVTGKMLRTSASRACNASNVSDTSACYPIICSPKGCTEAALKASEGDVDYPESPHRFVEDDLPGAVPVLRALFGVHATHPSVPGFEARLNCGIYDAFFAGGGVAYLF